MPAHGTVLNEESTTDGCSGCLWLELLHILYRLSKFVLTLISCCYIAIFTCALKWKFEGLVYTELIGYNDRSELLQLIKTKHELPPPGINGICERSRVPACLKTNTMFYSGCMALVKYKCRISDAVNSVFLDLCVASCWVGCTNRTPHGSFNLVWKNPGCLAHF